MLIIATKFAYLGGTTMSQPDSRSGSSVGTILIAIYMMVLSLITLCPSLAIVGCGGIFSGLMGSLRGASDSFGSGGQTASGAFLAADAVGGLVVLLGIFGLVLTVALFVYAIGLLSAKPWAYMGAIVLNGAYIGLQLIGAVMGSAAADLTHGVLGGISVVQIIFIVLSGGCIYVLIADREIRATFGRA